jgi:peptidoglycan hydrolase CwlO-like protein
MTTQEQLDRLTNIVDALASSVVAHDNQIEALIKVVDRNSEQIEKQGKQIETLGRQLQAYLTLLPKN